MARLLFVSILLYSFQAKANQQADAISHLEQATYKYYGLDVQLSNDAAFCQKHYLNPYVSKEVQAYAGWVAAAAKMVQSKMLTFKITFP